MRRLRLLWLLTAAIVLTAGIGAARSQNTVKLKGIVLDPQDARVARATITLESGKFRRLIYSDEAGAFETQLAVGIYQLTVSSNGFKNLQVKTLKVGTDVDDLEIHLEPENTGVHDYFPDWQVRIEPKNSPLPEKIKTRKIQ